MADNAKRDANSVTTLLALSNVDGITPVTLWADPVTHRLLVEATGSSGFATTALDNLSAVAINAALVLGTSDAFALGSATKMWSDLFLASGAVINFNNGDVTMTHSANALAFAGGTVSFDTAPTVGGGAVYYAGGTDVAVADGGTGLSAISALSILVANSANTFVELTPGAGNSIRMNAGGTAWEAYTPGSSGATTALDNLASVAINAALVLGTSDAFALGSTTKMWSDLFLASGAVVNFNNGDVTLTHGSNVLTLDGGDLALGANNLTITGSIGATGARATKVWAAAGEFTAAPTVSGAAVYYVGGTDVAVTDGGTGLSAIAALSLIVANSSNTYVALTPGAGQSIRINAGNTAWEAFTPGSSGATTALDNLASVAINAALVLGTSDAFALGSATKMWADLFLASGAVINFNNGDVTLTHGSNVLTLGGGDLALGSNNLTMTGSLAATGARVTKGWFADIESTNMPTVGGTSLASTFAPIASPTFTGTVTIPASVLNGQNNLDGTPASDHTAVGNVTNTFASGYSSTAMDLVFMGSGGKWLEADADAVATCNGLIGIALEAKIDTQVMLVALPGSFVRDDTWNWTPGATLYAGETLGAIQATIPTGANAIIKVIGFAVTADVIFFNPSPDQQSTVA